MLLRLLSAQALMPALFTAAALAGPIVCTTTMEAPDPSAPAGAAPVSLTTCEPMETTAERIERVTYTWTAPYGRGVDVVHQITDFFGIAVAGSEGNRVMGFGFPDQTLIWDGIAIENTTRALLEEQSPPLPTRTLDVPNGFDSSYAFDLMRSDTGAAETVVLPLQDPATPGATPVRPLW